MRTTMAEAALLLLLPLAACSFSETALLRVVPSHDVKTSDLDATFAIRGENGKLLASAYFGTGDAAVYLDGGDVVSCDGVLLTGDRGALFADVPRKPVGASYRFELRRATGSVFAEVDAIEPITVTAPAAAVEISRTRPLTVTWSPRPGTAVDAQLFANCAMTNLHADIETGAITLPAFVPKGVAGGPQNASNPPCNGTVSLTRTRKSTVDTAFARTELLADDADRVTVRVVE